MNPLLKNEIDISKVQVSDFLPALDEAINLANKRIEQFTKMSGESLAKRIEFFETLSCEMGDIASWYFALHSADCTEEIEKISQDFIQELTLFENDLYLNPAIFKVIKADFESDEYKSLPSEYKKVLENSYKGFVRNGALLAEKEKERLREIDQELGSLGIKLSDNARKSQNAFELIVDNDAELAGLGENYIEQARDMASQRGYDGKYLFTLDFPIYMPFMQQCKNEKLRQKMYEARSKVAVEGEFSNQDNIKKTVALRDERAKLLGYQSHADFVLEERMAKSVNTVKDFLDQLEQKSKAKAWQEFEQLKNLKKEITGIDEFFGHDQAFYTEILKKRELEFDDEELRPFFKLENVIEGVFKVASRLYEINFQVDDTFALYHPDVKAYKVFDHSNEYVGHFLADFFPRATKRSGAWMTDIKTQGLKQDKVERPIISIVCNFTPSTKDKPSLLTLNEVLTLFHEFGHALHGLLSKCHFRSVAGTNVLWDFVELPSQVMENWVYEKECLDLFASHYQTSEKIPQELIVKIKKSMQFQQGLGTLRQVSFAKLDMAWHAGNYQGEDVLDYEEQVMKDFRFTPKVDGANMSCSFGHIFGGGYAAGYYSYKWAEVLDADAFALFKSRGIFDPETAKSFKQNILEKGGTEDPSKLYREFRGQDAKFDALLERSGLL